MSIADQFVSILRSVFGLILTVFDVIANWLRALMAHAGIPHDLQSAVIVLLAVLFIVLVLRSLGGILRIVLVIFFVVLLLDVLGVITHGQAVHL